MFINIQSVSGLTADEIKTKINTLDCPAVLLDEALRVIDRNRESLEFTGVFKRGTRIHRYLPERDIEKITEMRPRDTLFSSIIAEGIETRVSIIGGIDCLLMVFLPSAGLCLEVVDKYVKMSGYDSVIREDLTENPRSVKGDGISGALAEIIDTVCVRRNELFSLPFFNAASVINRLVTEINRASVKNPIKVELSLDQSELISGGHERDFVLINAFAVALAHERSVDGSVLVEVDRSGDELIIDISCRIDESYYTIARNGSFRDPDGKYKLGGEDFRPYMLKLLADANLWDISAGVNDGRLCTRLVVPYIESGEEFALRDVDTEFLLSVVFVVFSLK